MDIGIQCEEAVQQFTKQRDITFSGKAVTVQRHLNIHATQQKASFKTLYQAVLQVVRTEKISDDKILCLKRAGNL